MIALKTAYRGFFDRAAVMNAVDTATIRALSKAGGWIRKTARNSIRPARRLRMNEMTQEQRKHQHIAESVAAREGRGKTKMPYKPSEPGEPPRSRSGVLRRFLFYSFDTQSRSVVIGPSALPDKQGHAPPVLEFGGTNKRGRGVDARPFMGPALNAAKDGGVLLDAWRNSVRAS